MYPPEVIDSYTKLIEQATEKVAEVLGVDLDDSSETEEAEE